MHSLCGILLNKLARNSWLLILQDISKLQMEHESYYMTCVGICGFAYSWYCSCIQYLNITKHKMSMWNGSFTKLHEIRKLSIEAHSHFFCFNANLFSQSSTFQFLAISSALSGRADEAFLVNSVDFRTACWLSTSRTGKIITPSTVLDVGGLALRGDLARSGYSRDAPVSWSSLTLSWMEISRR